MDDSAVEWTVNVHDKLLQLIQDKDEQPLKALQQLVAQLTGDNIDAFHTWRNAKFNLLFHSVVEEAKHLYWALLENGSDPREENDNGSNVLHLLMRRGLGEWAQVALDKLGPADKWRFINHQTYSGWTPLMAAVNNGHVHCVEWLLENGAAVNLAMNTGWTALHAAAKDDQVEMLEMLLRHGGNVTTEAIHRDFGRNLTVEDVTTNEVILKLLQKYQ